MKFSECSSVALLGAAGEVGREIALLLLSLMEGRGSIACIDESSDGLKALERDLTTRTLNKEWLRTVRFSTSPDAIAGSDLIFESIEEELTAKGRLLRSAGLLCPNGYFFTNTSAIPISEIAKESELSGRLIGFHFFNPPSRRLIELVCPERMSPELTSLSLEIVKRLQKRAIFSADVAGFMSGGYLLREIRYACGEVAELSQTHSIAGAISLMNQVTRELLIRPMGIFEVVDSIGVERCRQIGRTMSHFLSGSNFEIDLLNQIPEGKGFFEYHKGQPAKVYDIDLGLYVPIKRQEMRLEAPSWEELRESKQCKANLQIYFRKLFAYESEPAEIARDYLLESREIAQQLVRNGVARELDDVNLVLQLGFAHLYGPKNNHY
jgi:3-hydroxybutyryl-CoA dehydrogenase